MTDSPSNTKIDYTPSPQPIRVSPAQVAHVVAALQKMADSNAKIAEDLSAIRGMLQEENNSQG